MVTMVSDRSISPSHGPLFKGRARAIIPAANFRIKGRPTRDQCRHLPCNVNLTPNQGFWKCCRQNSDDGEAQILSHEKVILTPDRPTLLGQRPRCPRAMPLSVGCINSNKMNNYTFPIYAHCWRPRGRSANRAATAEAREGQVDPGGVTTRGGLCDRN